MKKIVCAFICILAIIPLISACAACDKTNNNTNQSPEIPAHTEQPFPHETPPQPIEFDVLASAISFVIDRDLSEYRKEWQHSYQSMIEILSANSQLLIASHSNANKIDDSVTLFPEAQYEDVGVGVWFKYEGVSYQVIIYSIKTETEYKVNQETEDITDYYEKRFGTPENYPYEYFDTNNLQIPQIVIRTIGADNSKLSARGLIDDTHYIVIKTKAEKTALLSFVDGLLIDSVPLK